MRRTAASLALLFVFALSSCDMLFPPYWVTGLTLPAGSTVVSKSQTTTSTGPTLPGGIPLTMPGLGAVDKTLTVSFNCSGGWSAVSGHIDRCMQRQGYADSMQSTQSMLGSYGGGAQGAAMAKMFSGMRMYSKGGSKYSVMLMDMGGMMSAVSAYSKQSAPSSLPGMGQFNLTVYKAK